MTDDWEVMRMRETKQKKGPRDVINVSWATGMFFLSLLMSFSFY